MYQLFLFSHFHSNRVLDDFTSSSVLGIKSLFLTSSEFVSFMGEKEGGGGGGGGAIMVWGTKCPSYLKGTQRVFSQL